MLEKMEIVSSRSLEMAVCKSAQKRRLLKMASRSVDHFIVMSLLQVMTTVKRILAFRQSVLPCTRLK